MSVYSRHLAKKTSTLITNMRDKFILQQFLDCFKSLASTQITYFGY